MLPGWAGSTRYALVDRTGKHDLSELTSLQNWLLKFELQTVDGVSEVATVGGMVRQYQVRVDPTSCVPYGIPLSLIETAIQQGNQGDRRLRHRDGGKRSTWCARTGTSKSVEDLKQIPLGTNVRGAPLLLG